MDRESWIKTHLKTTHIDVNEFPNIALYMDQVTTFMESHLADTKRYPEDKIMTKTMINNYTKNHLLPAPEKKKYSKEHLLFMVLIYYMKNILNLTDIQTLLGPLIQTASMDKKNTTLNLEEIYSRLMHSFDEQATATSENILDTYRISTELFSDLESTQDVKTYMEDFSFMCHLANEIYVRKQLLERLIDQRIQESPDISPTKKNSKKKS